MATLSILVTRQELIPILVPTDGAAHLRWVYGFPEFQTWLAVDLPNLEPGRLKAPDAPKEQMDNILYRWITGKDIRYGRQFQDLMPMVDEVWEMKTPDLRIFGWIYQPRKFIAVFGDYADLYKGANKSRSYAAAVQRVKRKRD